MIRGARDARGENSVRHQTRRQWREPSANFRWQPLTAEFSRNPCSTPDDSVVGNAERLAQAPSASLSRDICRRSVAHQGEQASWRKIEMRGDAIAWPPTNCSKLAQHCAEQSRPDVDHCIVSERRRKLTPCHAGYGHALCVGAEQFRRNYYPRLALNGLDQKGDRIRSDRRFQRAGIAEGDDADPGANGPTVPSLFPAPRHF
jgi:hypothetical protein